MSRGRHATLTSATMLLCISKFHQQTSHLCVCANTHVCMHKNISVYPDGHFSTLKKSCVCVCVSHNPLWLLSRKGPPSCKWDAVSLAAFSP